MPYGLVAHLRCAYVALARRICAVLTLHLRCALAMRLKCGWNALAPYLCNGGDSIERPLRVACNAFAVRWRCAFETHALNKYALLVETHTRKRPAR